MPKDPVMLLGFVNLKLRAYYRDFDTVCEELELDRDVIVQKLSSIDYHYDETRNQFV